MCVCVCSTERTRGGGGGGGVKGERVSGKAADTERRGVCVGKKKGGGGKSNATLIHFFCTLNTNRCWIHKEPFLCPV